MASVQRYLRSRPRRVRWQEWALGRRYLVARFEDCSGPIVIVAHSFRDAGVAGQIARAIREDWKLVPGRCRESYHEILSKAPDLVIVQLRRKNLCGCLGHRHVVVREAPFREPHEALGGGSVGEMDIAYQRVATWPALPLSDTALDAKFLEGSRQAEFRAEQFRLKLLSILLHETTHLVLPEESEPSVREKSLAFYHDALASYVENSIGTLSLTIDRSFSRLE